MYPLLIRGGVFDNTKAALREIADQAGFAYEKAWTTQQFGSKLVDFLNANAPSAATKSESKKQHIRVEVEITEHDYAAFDSDDAMLDTFAFNGDDSPNEVRIYIDGEEYDFEDEDPMDVINSKYSDYETFDMEQMWDNEDIVKFGYYDNVASKVWEFDVENFDINKLSFYYECFDASFGPADYECEEHRITLRYDGKEVEEDFDAYGCSDGDFEQEWYLYDYED